MLQRRKVDAPAISDSASSSATTPSRPGRPLASKWDKKRGGGSDNVVVLLLVIVVLIGTISILSPATVQHAEEKAASTTKEFVHEAYVAEQHMEDYLLHQQQSGAGQLPPMQQLGEDAPDPLKQESVDATEAMKRQPSSWVDGEKKLKLKLKELAARQQDGKDLGAPILTRWLGDDVSAWVSEGGDVAAWEKLRDAKYEEMKKEEERWRAEVRHYLEHDADEIPGAGGENA